MSEEEIAVLEKGLSNFYQFLEVEIMAFAKISQVAHYVCQSKWLQITTWLRLWIPNEWIFQVERE